MFKLLCILVVAGFATGFVIQDTLNFNRDEAKDTDTFYYFGFGSNMLTKRIHIQNPTAVRVGLGKVENYRLDFGFQSKRWTGSVATIVPTPNATVYGALWEINISNLADIDNQEGVHTLHYRPESVKTLLANGTEVTARAYVLVDQPETDISLYKYDEVPQQRQPSKSYLQCVIKGAIETGLPTSYIDWLKSLKHTGYVHEKLEKELDLQDVELYN